MNIRNVLGTTVETVGNTRKQGNKENENSVFFCQRHALSTNFYFFVATYRVTNFMPKLDEMLLFCWKKPEFLFFVFPYFWELPNQSCPPNWNHFFRFFEYHQFRSEHCENSFWSLVWIMRVSKLYRLELGKVHCISHMGHCKKHTT